MRSDFAKALRTLEENHSELRPWGLLAYDAIIILRQIYKEWTNLLDDPNTNERDTLRFLSDHVNLFLNDPPEKPFVISELRLGAEYRLDFLEIKEGYSSGTNYTLIEVESPNSKLFKSDGRTSARLSGAIDQIFEWRRWIAAHRYEAQKLFPSLAWRDDGQPYLDYKIIIGRRDETKQSAGKLSSIWKEQNITVMSFDRLTDSFVNRGYSSFFSTGLSSQCLEFSDDLYLLNKAASPFLKPMCDSKWREVCKVYDFSCHILPKFLAGVANNLDYNERLIESFDKIREIADKDAVYQMLKDDFQWIKFL